MNEENRIEELQNMTADWHNQFLCLVTLCEKRGLKVGYGEAGEVTLDDAR